MALQAIIRYARSMIVASLLALLTPVFSPLAQETKAEDIYSKSLPSIMTLRAELEDGKTSTGTAFLALRDGMAITASHVIVGAKRVTAKFSSGEEFEVSGVVDQDVKRDVAIIRVKTFGRPMLALEPLDPAVGSKAYVIGAPRGLDFTMSDGLVSQIRILDGMKQIQFSCPASPGNSGGPLIDSKGRVIGIIDWQLNNGQNLNFAIHIGYAMGLDLTLPTVPWDDVKVTRTVAASASSEAVDSLLTRTTMMLWDGLTLADVLKDQVVTSPGGYKNGLPVAYYSIVRELEKVQKELNDLGTLEEPQEAVRKRYEKVIPALLQGLVKHRDAITSAQQDGGWSPKANEQVREGWSFISGVFDQSGLAGIKDVPFSKALPPDLKIGLGFEKDTSGFMLGVTSWAAAPTDFVLVAKDQFAWKLGFRPGDTIRAIDGKPIALVSELKSAIVASLGKKLTIKIQRGSVEKDLQVKIPKEIPKEFLRG